MCGCVSEKRFKEKKQCSKCNGSGKLCVGPDEFIDCTCVREEIECACKDYYEIDKAIAEEWRSTETNPEKE